MSLHALARELREKAAHIRGGAPAAEWMPISEWIASKADELEAALAAVDGAVELSDAQCDAITDVLDDTAWGYQDARIAIRYAIKSTLNPGGSRDHD